MFLEASDMNVYVVKQDTPHLAVIRGSSVNLGTAPCCSCTASVVHRDLGMLFRLSGWQNLVDHVREGDGNN